jgi:hypothetical protein
MVRATIGAGGTIPLVDYITPGDGLGVRLVSSFSGTDPFVELAGHRHRANLGTITATGAALQINEPGLSSQGYLKSSRVARYAFDLRESE